jgi:deoxyguanosine kinase
MTYIVVEGPIGVGKTVLTRLLGERLAMPTVFEQFEENPFLSNFYADRARYAFQTEVFFLLNRYRQQESVVGAALRGRPKPAAGTGNLASDYLFAKTKLFASMNLGGDELKLFEQLYEALAKQVPRPDLVVYLRASVDTLMARIYQRDRWFERSMERPYIERLSQVYESFFDTYSESPLLKIETDDLDLVRDVKAQQETISMIDAARS